MKKNFLRIITVVVCLSLPGNAAALSDADYLQMKRDSPEYASAEQNLTRVWKDLKNSMPQDKYYILLQEQRDWIRAERDAFAAGYMRQGYSRVEAYTMATNDRANFLPERAREIINKVSAAQKFLGVQ